jgi:hypothetical protein
LPDECGYGNDESLCTICSNTPNECPKFCGLCVNDMMKWKNIGVPTQYVSSI